MLDAFSRVLFKAIGFFLSDYPDNGMTNERGSNPECKFN
jgi:hypothetical protein